MKKYAIVFMSFFLLFSCVSEKENPRPQAQGKIYTLTASIGEKTRAFIDGEGDFSWESGDEIKVLDSRSGELLTFVCEDGDGVFSFTGEPGREYTFTKAWYPASMVSSADVVTFPASWDYADVSEPHNFPMAATVEEGHMSFYHLGGILKLTVNEVPADASALILSSPDVSLSGNLSVTALGLDDGRVDAVGEDVVVEDGTIPVVKSVDEITAPSSGDGTTVSVGLSLSSKQQVVVYVPLPCGSYRYKITLKAGEETLLERQTGSPKNIGRAVMTRMGALTVPWPETSLKAKYGSTEVSFEPSDLWGWYVARGLPAATDIVIDDSGTLYGTRFATKKHAGYFSECISGSEVAFPLKEASDLYISEDKTKIFPRAAGAPAVIPTEYEVAHYGLRGDFAGGITSYVSAGEFVRTDDTPASSGGWKWYVVRNVACTGTPIAFKPYATAYVAADGVLETGTSTPQVVGSGRTMARPVSGSTYSVRYNVTPGMSYDIYLREDLRYMTVCEAGTYNSSFDESYLVGLTNYGLYNYGGTSYICSPGIDQTWMSSTAFVIAKGFTFDQIEFTGLPGTPALGDTVDVGLTITPSVGSGSSSVVRADVVRIDGNKLWLLSEDGTGIIADYRR